MQCPAFEPLSLSPGMVPPSPHCARLLNPLCPTRMAGAPVPLCLSERQQVPVKQRTWSGRCLHSIGCPAAPGPPPKNGLCLLGSEGVVLPLRGAGGSSIFSVRGQWLTFWGHSLTLWTHTAWWVASLGIILCHVKPCKSCNRDPQSNGSARQRTASCPPPRPRWVFRSMTWGSPSSPGRDSGVTPHVSPGVVIWLMRGERNPGSSLDPSLGVCHFLPCSVRDIKSHGRIQLQRVGTSLEAAPGQQTVSMKEAGEESRHGQHLPPLNLPSCHLGRKLEPPCGSLFLMSPAHRTGPQISRLRLHRPLPALFKPFNCSVKERFLLKANTLRRVPVVARWVKTLT